MEEQGYLDLMSDVLSNGFDKPNRTNTNTRSLTGATLRFVLGSNNDLSQFKKTIPLLTTKSTPFRLIATELLWFLNGDTSVRTLSDQKNHIWDANGSREFLDSRGLLMRDEGDLGPLYGWQWRHWNAPYVELKDRPPYFSFKDFRKSPKSGIDQITTVINNIKNDPWSRRHIVSAWNPEQLDEMALVPCHSFFQFIVRPRTYDNVRPRTYDNVRPISQKDTNTEDLKLNIIEPEPYWLDCVMYQRSADLPLGVPFNIASYSLLTHMIAHHTGLNAGEFVHNMGDVHIYHNQFDGCETQLKRTPGEFPTLEFINPPDCIDNWSMDNFKVKNYKHQGRIKFPFST